jgi:hypothetical protein
MTVSNSDEEEAPIPNNTSPKTCKGNILFLPIFQFLNVCLSIFFFRAYAPGQNKQYLSMSNLCLFWVSLHWLIFIDKSKWGHGWKNMGFHFQKAK